MTRWIDLLARVGLAALFLYAGAMKLRSPAAFVEEIENYRLISGQLALAAGYFVPWLEMLAAIALLSKRLRLCGWIVSVALSAAFTLFVVSAWARGLDISCGCFGSSSTPVGPGAASRAVAILVISMAGLCGECKNQLGASHR